jgi:hypothetical protein
MNIFKLFKIRIEFMDAIRAFSINVLKVYEKILKKVGVDFFQIF